LLTPTVPPPRLRSAKRLLIWLPAWVVVAAAIRLVLSGFAVMLYALSGDDPSSPSAGSPGEPGFTWVLMLSLSRLASVGNELGGVVALVAWLWLARREGVSHTRAWWVVAVTVVGFIVLRASGALGFLWLP